MASTTSYDRQVRSQISQYSAADCAMHDLPAIAHYVNGLNSPKWEAIFGSKSLTNLFAQVFSDALAFSESRRFGSIGSGDCDLEVEIAQLMLNQKATNFEIVCYEISPILAERGRTKVEAAGLGDIVKVVEGDLNQPTFIEGTYAGFMASHSLHHILNLEKLFDSMRNCLDQRGSFVVSDMIGRNGHARWPEILGLLHEIWALLPDKYKFDHMYRITDRWFENRDCSIEGFEGIRAQDILPMLIERFHFERFYAWSGLVDVFIDRSFGPNFDVKSLNDTAFIASLQAAEDALLDLGQTTPTAMFAILRKDDYGKQEFYGPRSPDRCVRPLGGVGLPAIRLSDTQIRVPYPVPSPVVIKPFAFDTPVSFGASGHGDIFLRWGWAAPDPDFRWAVGESSALQFATSPGTAFKLTVGLLAYLPSFVDQQRLRIEVNGTTIDDIIFEDRSDTYREVTVEVPAGLLPNGSCLLELVPAYTRRPDLEDGPDKRPLTFALFSASISGTR